jgi:hypothetical protein
MGSVGRLTERRTPIPVKITPTGGYASKRGSVYGSRVSRLWHLKTTYQANAPANGFRKCTEDVYSRIQPR